MDKQALFDKMREKGINITAMYKSLNMSRSAFYRKCNGQSEFTIGEVNQIMSILGIDDPVGIFFKAKVA